MGSRNSMDGHDSLSLDLLQSEDQIALLDRINELRNLGFRHRLSLPQLVVCGDQNSGKSSVFEAITGVKLPVHGELCTRFATEVIFHKSIERSAHVRIRPGPNATPDHKHKLAIFTRPHKWLSDIPKLFSEARLIMGLTREGQYSEDTLQLEIFGPTLPSLTVVDLPGLLHAPGRNQTSEDVAMVRRMTENYMRNPRSIVLAIASAEHLLSQQSVLHLARCCTSRTMGIVTKLDLLEPDAPNGDTFYARAKKQDTPLKLGWHLLRNLDTEVKDTGGLSRDQLESLFFTSASPWKSLSPAAVGITSLRRRLGKVLMGQIELQLSMLSFEIRRDLQSNRELLQKLGSSDSAAEQRLRLTKIGERYQSLANNAVLGEYHEPFFRYRPNHSVRRLRSLIRNWAEEFALDMRNRSHTYDIHEDSTTIPMNSSALSPDDPQPITRTKTIIDLSDLLKHSKGREFSVIGEIFIRNSTKWPSMAKAHVSQVWKLVKRFLDDLLHHIADAGINEAILQTLIGHEMEDRLQILHDKIDELISPYKRVIPTTLNPELTARIRDVRLKDPTSQKNNGIQVDDMNNPFYSKLLDCAQAYYTVALNNFVDNVASLAVENCLIDGLENLISPSKITQMSDNEIERIASESEDAGLARATLVKKVEVLEVAAATCTRCEMLALGSAASIHRTGSNSSSFYEPTAPAAPSRETSIVPITPIAPTVPTSPTRISDPFSSSTSVSSPSPKSTPSHKSSSSMSSIGSDLSSRFSADLGRKPSRPYRPNASTIFRAFPRPLRQAETHHSVDLPIGRPKAELSFSPPQPLSPIALPPKNPARTLSVSSHASRESSKSTRNRITKPKPLPEDKSPPWVIRSPTQKEFPMIFNLPSAVS